LFEIEPISNQSGNVKIKSLDGKVKCR